MSPDHESGSGGNFSLRITAAIAAGVWIGAVVAYLQAAREADAILAVCLLGIPVAVCIVLALRHGPVSGLLNWLLGATLALVAFQGLVLWGYTFRSAFVPWFYDGLSLLAVVVAVGSVIGSLALASMMLTCGGSDGADPALTRPARLVCSLRSHPAVAICFFVAAFCLVTIFLAFGLAFHDQGLRLAAGEEVAEIGGGPQEEAGTEPRVSFGRPPVGIYAFPVGPALPAERVSSPEADRVGSPMAEIWKIRFSRGKTEVLSGSRYRGYSKGDIAELRGEELIAATNEQQLEHLADHIASRNGHSRLQVVIAGRADDTRPPDGQMTNFEISRARANQVWLEILHRLQDREHGWSQHIQWYPMAFGDQGTFLDPTLDARPGSEDRLLVEIAVLPSSELLAMPVEPERLGRPLDLLDYLYFTVYTVTTTGYGDIVPVSGYAKLTTSLANLSEFLFMVIFFNVLVSFLRKPVPVSGTGDS